MSLEVGDRVLIIGGPGGIKNTNMWKVGKVLRINLGSAAYRYHIFLPGRLPTILRDEAELLLLPRNATKDQIKALRSICSK